MRTKLWISLLLMSSCGLAAAQSVELRVTGVILPSACQTNIHQPTLSTSAPQTSYTFQCQPGNNGVLRQAYTPNGAQIEMQSVRGKPGETNGKLMLRQMPANGAHSAFLEVYYF